MEVPRNHPYFYGLLKKKNIHLGQPHGHGNSHRKKIRLFHGGTISISHGNISMTMKWGSHFQYQLHTYPNVCHVWNIHQHCFNMNFIHTQMLHVWNIYQHLSHGPFFLQVDLYDTWSIRDIGGQGYMNSSSESLSAQAPAVGSSVTCHDMS